VTIHPPGGQAFFWIKDGQKKYLIIDGFIVDGQKTALHGFKFSDNTRYIRVKNTEIKNTGHGVLVTLCSGCANKVTAPMNTYHEFINMDVHHNGTYYTDHGFYISTSFNLIENSKIYSNAGYGLHWYNASYQTVNNNVSRHNIVYNNGADATHNSCGILLSSGHNNEAYGNIVYGNLIGLCSGYKSTNAKFYNNVVYENKIDGIYVGTGGNEHTLAYNNSIYKNGIRGIFVGDGARNAVVQNNIAYQNISKNIFIEPGDQVGTTDSHNLTIDPKFMNTLAKDFRLKKGSPAIDGGIRIDGITTDFDNLKRDIGVGPDIGAYEFFQAESDSTPPNIPKDVRILSIK